MLNVFFCQATYSSNDPRTYGRAIHLLETQFVTAETFITQHIKAHYM